MTVFAASGPVASYAHFLDHAAEQVAGSDGSGPTLPVDESTADAPCDLCHVLAGGRAALLPDACTEAPRAEGVAAGPPRTATDPPRSPHRAPASPRAPPLS